MLEALKKVLPELSAVSVKRLVEAAVSVVGAPLVKEIVHKVMGPRKLTELQAFTKRCATFAFSAFDSLCQPSFQFVGL